MEILIRFVYTMLAITYLLPSKVNICFFLSIAGVQLSTRIVDTLSMPGVKSFFFKKLDLIIYSESDLDIRHFLVAVKLCQMSNHVGC